MMVVLQVSERWAEQIKVGVVELKSLLQLRQMTRFPFFKAIIYL